MLIDFHTHAFPDKIAQPAVKKLAQAAGGMVPQTDGTVDSLKAQLQLDGVTLCVVHSIATNPAQQHKVNSFAIEMNRDPQIEAFGSVHPDAPDALEELDLGTYGMVLRAKGILAAEDGSWIHFDFVPGEMNLRTGSADTTGKLCVIGSKLDEHGIQHLFGL